VQVAGKPLAVSLALDLIDRLEREVVENFRSLTSRGSEIGGLLLGHASAGSDVPTIVSVVDYQTIACDYSRGPLYRFPMPTRDASSARSSNIRPPAARLWSGSSAATRAKAFPSMPKTWRLSRPASSIPTISCSWCARLPPKPASAGSFCGKTTACGATQAASSFRSVPRSFPNRERFWKRRASPPRFRSPPPPCAGIETGSPRPNRAYRDAQGIRRPCGQSRTRGRASAAIRQAGAAPQTGAAPAPQPPPRRGRPGGAQTGRQQDRRQLHHGPKISPAKPPEAKAATDLQTPAAEPAAADPKIKEPAPAAKIAEKAKVEPTPTASAPKTASILTADLEPPPSRNLVPIFLSVAAAVVLVVALFVYPAF